MPHEAHSTESQPAASPEPDVVSDFERALQDKYKLTSISGEDEEHRQRQIRYSVQGFVDESLKRAGTLKIKSDVLDYIQSMIKMIDEEVSDQLNKVMHAPEFTKLEGSWRGLDHLVSRTETDAQLKIQVLNISKKELYRELEKTKGEQKFDRGTLFKKVYEEEFGMPGGEPYGAMIGDFEFDHSTQDILILREMARIAAASHCPFIAAAGPKLMQMDSWQGLNDRHQLDTLFATPDYNAWRTFRESADSRFVGLTMPRFLSRAPYSTRDNPTEGFAFEEDVNGSSHDKFVWSNSAYAMGANINRAFKLYGWCARIRGTESGGIVEELPQHTFPTDDGKTDVKCPTEIGITDRREGELASLGFMPLSHWKNTDYAVFMGAQSMHKPEKFYDEDASANANLSARLPYLFACCRFAHYLKCMVRDKVGSYMDADQMRIWLEDWISRYVTDSGASETAKLERPLAKAEVTLQENPENPGEYVAQFFLRPHYQLEKVNISLRLVSRLPRDRKQ